MILPALREAINEVKQGFGSDLIGLNLDLKSVGSEAQVAQWLNSNGYPRLAENWGYGSQTYTGRSVTPKSSLNHSVVWCCRKIIAETIGAMPLHLMTQDGDNKEQAKKHPLYSVLHDEPNPEMSDVDFKQSITDHAVSWGNGYAQIVRRSGSGETVGLNLWLPDETRTDRVKATNELVYLHKESGREKTYPMRDVFHLRGFGFDGIQGYSVIRMLANSISRQQVKEEWEGRFYERGGRGPLYGEYPNAFKNRQDKRAVEEDFDKIYGNLDSAFKILITENGLKLNPLGLHPVDAQFIESMQLGIPEICRGFRISPHMVADLSRATFSNIEHLALEFVQHTMMPWITAWEKAVRRCLLTPAEKDRYFAKFNVNGLLRADYKTRMEGYASALQNGHLSIDEVRDYEDLNPLPKGEGKKHRVQLNMQEVGAKPQPAPVPAKPAA